MSHTTVLFCCPCSAGDEERAKMVMLQRVVRGLHSPMLGCQLSRKSHARLPSSDLEHMLISTGAIPRCVWVFFLCFFGLFSQSHANSGCPRIPAPSCPWLPSSRAIGMHHHLCFKNSSFSSCKCREFLLSINCFAKSRICNRLWAVEQLGSLVVFA